jgi:hypothetical protein
LFCVIAQWNGTRSRAGLDMTAQSRRAAMLDRRHDLELMKAQVSGVGGPIGGAGSTENVGDLE